MTVLIVIEEHTGTELPIVTEILIITEAFVSTTFRYINYFNQPHKINHTTVPTTATAMLFYHIYLFIL